MTKFILVLHLCSMVTGQCPSTHYSIKASFSSHYDCVLNGYAVAQQTFKNLKEIEDVEQDIIEQSKMVVKFECRPIKYYCSEAEAKGTRLSSAYHCFLYLGSLSFIPKISYSI